MNDLKTLLSPVTTFIFDYDGVMTDGTVYIDSNGDPLRCSNVKDGYALQLASKLGYHVAVISGAIVTNITKRLNSLGVKDVFIGAADTLKPAIMSLTSMWCVRLTLAAYLARDYGLRGVWTAMAIELTFRGLIFLVRMIRGNWMKNMKPVSA